MRPEDVRFIAVEGGGAGGLLIHPGVLQALETLQVVRRENFKPAGILGWSGSSSGSIISTLVSCGYASWEIALLASQEAFDMIFRLEPIQPGAFASIQGGCRSSASPSPAVEPDMGALIAGAILDPAGGAVDLLHKSRLLVALSVENTPKIYQAFLTEQANRIDAILRDGEKKGTQRFKTLATEASREYGLRIKKWRSPPQNVFTLLEAEFPHLVPKLVGLLSAHAAGKVKGPSIFQILKQDFGLASGCLWRDYIDHLLAFARFRVRFTADLPSLALPHVPDMKAVPTLDALFHQAVERAVIADYGSGASVPVFVAEYDRLRHCTFWQHAAEFYDWLGSPVVPPLIISGANITTRESHLFSALATPGFHVADAVRMATSLPPVFKPVKVEAADIPSSWPAQTDRFGSGHYLQGLWVDGGLYYNAPFEVFKDASSSFTAERYTMGIGAGIEERAVMDNLTQFATAFINMGYEANTSASRVNLENYLNINRFDIGFTKAKVLPKVLEYYRLDAYWRTFQFLGQDPGF